MGFSIATYDAQSQELWSDVQHFSFFVVLDQTEFCDYCNNGAHS